MSTLMYSTLKSCLARSRECVRSLRHPNGTVLVISAAERIGGEKFTRIGPADCTQTHHDIPAIEPEIVFGTIKASLQDMLTGRIAKIKVYSLLVHSCVAMWLVHRITVVGLKAAGQLLWTHCRKKLSSHFKMIHASIARMTYLRYKVYAYNA